MPGDKSKVICPNVDPSKYPYHGIGIKVGDPFALTYKFYPNKRLAFGADFGQSASALYTGYYKSHFDSYLLSDTLQTNEQINYLTHEVKTDWIFEVRALYRFTINKVSPGFEVYIGPGFEFRELNIRYNYVYDNGTNTEIFYFERKRFTYGVQATLGIEYSAFRIPISAFMELEVFADLNKDPGYKRAQGGVGLRYIFYNK